MHEGDDERQSLMKVMCPAYSSSGRLWFIRLCSRSIFHRFYALNERRKGEMGLQYVCSLLLGKESLEIASLERKRSHLHTSGMKI